MIAPLRARHRWMFLVLALILAPLLVMAFSARPQFPSQPSPKLAATGSSGAGLHHESLVSRPFSGLDAELRQHPEAWTLELGEALRSPDVLAYWGPEAPTGTDLPAGVFLLGPVSSARLNTYRPLPEAARTQDGYLILFSLGHQAVVTSGAVNAQAVNAQGGSPS